MTMKVTQKNKIGWYVKVLFKLNSGNGLIKDTSFFFLLVAELRENRVGILKTKSGITSPNNFMQLQCCSFKNQQSPVYLVNRHFSGNPDRCSECCHNLAILPHIYHI